MSFPAPIVLEQNLFVRIRAVRKLVRPITSRSQVRILYPLPSLHSTQRSADIMSHGRCAFRGWTSHRGRAWVRRRSRISLPPKVRRKGAVPRLSFGYAYSISRDSRRGPCAFARPRMLGGLRASPLSWLRLCSVLSCFPYPSFQVHPTRTTRGLSAVAHNGDQKSVSVPEDVQELDLRNAGGARPG